MVGDHWRAALGLVKWILISDRESGGVSRWIAALVVVAVTTANAACQLAGLYGRFDWADLDRLQAAVHGPRETDVRAVLIADGEYDDPNLFGGTSPLAPDAVARIVHAICALEPAVLAVDVLTDHWTPAQLTALRAKRAVEACRIVWAHDSFERDGDSIAPDAGAPHELGKVLGLAAAPMNECSALPLLGRDSDGVVRRYLAAYAVRRHDGTVGYEPTLPVALEAGRQGRDACVGRAPDREGPARSERIRFTDSRILQLPAGFVLAAVEGGNDVRRAQAREMIKQKVVVLGGSFRHARDLHATPVGALPGAVVIAHAVWTLRHPIRDVAAWKSYLLDLAVGLSLFALTARLRLRWPWAILTSAVTTAAAAFVMSWVLFNYLGYFLGVFASLGGVVLGTAVDLSWEHLYATWRTWNRELRAKVGDYRRRVAEIQAHAARAQADREAGARVEAARIKAAADEAAAAKGTGSDAEGA